MAPRKRKYKEYNPNQANSKGNTIMQTDQFEDQIEETNEVINEETNEEEIIGDDMNNIVIENNINDLNEEIKPVEVVNETSETTFINTVIEEKIEELDTTNVIISNDDLICNTEKIIDPSIVIEFDNIVDITYINQSNNSTDKIVAYNKELKLVLGRHYLIPITNKNLSSDNFMHIKHFSNIAGKIDIRYVKNGVAYIIPMINNITVVDNERLGFLC